MEQVAVRTLNQHTAEVIARVERGEVVEITNRGRPVARIVPLAADPMADLVADNVAVPPTITGPVPMPQVTAEPGSEAGALVSALRDEERW
ncbi:MAG: type II toxin-antitoxin system prevent-host-death family antitoxin [Micromonosporaceae bacterium]|nr:type II toxin-antitoxin system prevent-host-death family antitoxin [Micromonosporaceae bacterium]